MLHQNSSLCRPQTRSYGCYGYSLLWWAWRLTGIDLTQEFINEDLYYKFVKSGYMTETWFIKQPVGILQYLRVPVTSVRKESAGYRPKGDELVIGQWKADGDISHFVAMYPDGSVAYDPWFSPEGGSRAVREGKLISWRVFN